MLRFTFSDTCAWVLSCLFLLSATIQSQEKIEFRRLSVEEGLSQSVVHCIIQDSYGFMWIATGAGLNRYNGHRFDIFKQVPGDSTSLSDNEVQTIFEDDQRNLWVGTLNGLNKLSLSDPDEAGYRKEIFRQYHHDPEDPNSLTDNIVRKIFQDREGILWVAGNKGLNKLSPAAEYERKFVAAQYVHDPQDSNSLGRGRISAIMEDRNGAIWIGAVGGGLNRFDREAETFFRYVHQSDNSNSLSSNFVMAVYEDQSGRIWIGTYGGGLNIFDPAANTFEHYKSNPDDPHSLSSNKVYDIKTTGDGIYWIGTFGGGLNRLDFHSGIFSVSRNVGFDLQSLSNDFIREIFIDRSSILWVATNDGVNLLDLKPQKFIRYRHDPHNENTIQNNRVLSVLEDSSRDLWVGTNDGLDRIKAGNQPADHMKIRHANPRSQGGFVYSIAEDRDGFIWAGSFGGGVLRIDKQDLSYVQFQSDADNPGSISDNRVYDILVDKKDGLWVATLGGLNKITRNGNRVSFSQINSPDDNPQRFTSHLITQLHESRDGTLWVGTADGLNQFDPATGNVVQFPHDPSDNTALSHKMVTTIFEDQSGTLWVGTNYGLSRLNLKDREKGTFRHYFERDGLPSNNICSITGDESGNLWIATIRGLAKFNPNDPEENQFRIYDMADGLQSNEFQNAANFRNPDGDIYLGGINGLNKFTPGNVLDNPFPPPIAFTAVKKYDQVLKTGRAITETEQLDLSYEDRFFSVEFVGLDFTNPQKNRYRYMMEGFDSDWIDAGNRRFASYTNLDAGDYRFRVKAANNDGIWNEEGISMAVRIAPPFWQTWWFRILAFIAIAGILGFLYRYRVAKLLEIERMRVRIASDLHDDVGSSLTKISLYSDLINSTDSKQEMRTMVDKIGTMSRDLIVTMSDIVWSIDARNDTVEDLLDRMRDFAMSVFAAKNIDYSFDVKQLDMQKKLPINIRQNLYLIFKEAVNNVAKHSRATSVHIHFFKDHGKYKLIIEDDGIGLNGNGKTSGHGLNNMKMRAKRIDGNLTFTAEEGTRVELTLDKI